MLFFQGSFTNGRSCRLFGYAVVYFYSRRSDPTFIPISSLCSYQNTVSSCSSRPFISRVGSTESARTDFRPAWQ